MSKKNKADAYKKRNRSVKILFFMMLLAVGVASFAGFVIAFFGALPTLAAWYRDNNPSKSLGYTVAMTNMACILLVLKDILPLGQNLSAAMPYLQSPWYWLMIYAGAAVGWGVYTITPKFVIKTLRWNFQGKINELRRTQEHLIDQWGQDVVSE